MTPLCSGRGAGRVCDVNTAPPRNRAGKSICQDAAHQLAFAGIITHLRTAGFRELIRGSPGSRDSQGGKGNTNTQHSPALMTVPGALPEAPGALPAPRGNLAHRRGPWRTPQYNSNPVPRSRTSPPTPQRGRILAASRCRKSGWDVEWKEVSLRQSDTSHVVPGR